MCPKCTIRWGRLSCTQGGGGSWGWSHGVTGNPRAPEARGGKGAWGHHAGSSSSTGTYPTPHALFRPSWVRWAIANFREHRNISGGLRLTREELKGKPNFKAVGGTHGYSVEVLSRRRGPHGDCNEIAPGRGHGRNQLSCSRHLCLGKGMAKSSPPWRLQPCKAPWTSHLPPSTPKPRAGGLRLGRGGPKATHSHLP